MSNKLTYLDFAAAVSKSLELAIPTTLTQKVSLLDSLGKVLSQDIFCIKNLPSFNNSAMDGFAIRYSDAGKTLNIKRVIYAGDKEDKVKANLKENECYKIMTGAQVPTDADTIIPIENCTNVTNTQVTIPSEIKKSSNLRLKGEEQTKGNILLKKGETITSSTITLLASQGIVMVEVFKDISIAVLSTGDELKEPWENSNDDEIYNCNSYALVSLLKENGFNATYSGVIPDNLEKSKEFISNLKNYDVVITSGGISMGDADFMAQAFLSNGLETAFHGVNIKPGRPIMMGKMQKTFVISLPGNPLTAMVNAHLFVIPVLKKIQGNSGFYHDIEKVNNQKEFKTKQGRVNVVLGSCENGGFIVTRDNKYGSGMITALYESNALLVTNEATNSIKHNQEVGVIRFNNKFLTKQVNILN
ncbi:molybdopterin molybdenumtransferase MoeA [Malaciobacter molluscorum LMG 25693]|uniref:Molybdopterin molybdenumtransferase n=1 Tax=Malaciobacter molluscorum LMG 25693 TaxID=870501 RepID=A0A2G1DL68_9BACT|nr:molybdopterin molybdotransferase MoeA [Malaciobacter molluscorum]AXX91977.1 molybdopterin molybdenumtransferase [Malaciobacter molluscorum LMG 25693]PHO19210.1 molybdopterin molybdenumtransferase MoeA [Malaciobacter molluscorum LMG 25693]